MPIYEYACRKGHEFEELQSFSSKPVARCPECGGEAKRKISLSSFHLKGSGWYLTDSKGSTKDAGGAKDLAATKSEEKASGTKDPEGAKPVETSPTPEAASSEKTSAPEKIPPVATAAQKAKAPRSGSGRKGKSSKRP